MSDKDPVALLERAVVAAEQKATPEEIAAWEAEKAAQTEARAKHVAHMDRAEERALASLAIDERQAAALERIAAAVEALAAVLEPAALQPKPAGQLRRCDWHADCDEADRRHKLVTGHISPHRNRALIR